MQVTVSDYLQESNTMVMQFRRKQCIPVSIIKGLFHEGGMCSLTNCSGSKGLRWPLESLQHVDVK